MFWSEVELCLVLEIWVGRLFSEPSLEFGIRQQGARELLFVVSQLVFVEIELIHIRDVRRSQLLFQDLLGADLPQPRVEQNLLDAFEAAQPQLLVLVQQPFQEHLEILGQLWLLGKSEFLADDCLFEFLLVLTVKGREPRD